jgi:hypothetical protein
MNLTEAIAHRDHLREQGVKCQLKHQGSDVWVVELEVVDYRAAQPHPQRFVAW